MQLHSRKPRPELDTRLFKSIKADLSTTEGVDKLYLAINGRKVDALLTNAGRGLGSRLSRSGFL
jgi:short-subunit dehydrogenase